MNRRLRRYDQPAHAGNQLVPKSPGLLAPELDYILLDGSGSMISKWDETLASLEAYRTTIIGARINSHGILHVFDDPNIEYIQRDSLIQDWPRFDRGSVDLPAGGTPLWDAINIMGRRLNDLSPKKCSIAIATDGQADRDGATSEAQARAVLDWCRAQGWQVIFLGVDFNNSGQAAGLGADATNFIGVQKGKMREAGQLLGRKRVRYSQTGEDIGFDDNEKSTFGGYLNGPSAK